MGYIMAECQSCGIHSADPVEASEEKKRMLFLPEPAGRAYWAFCPIECDFREFLVEKFVVPRQEKKECK